MTNAALQTLAQAHLQVGVHSLLVDGKKYWLKVQGEEKVNPVRRISVWLSHRPALRLFQVNSVLSAKQRMQLEITNNQIMRTLGLAVPEIVLEGENYFITRDAGIPLTRQKFSSEQWHPILLAVFAELSRFHQAGGYHGRPALRDIVLDSESHLTFIDLEESGTNNDPALMARDIFLLLMDLRRLPQISSAQKLEYLQHWQAQAPQAAYEALEELHQVVKKLAPIGRLVLKFKNNKTALDYLSAVETLSTYLSK